MENSEVKDTDGNELHLTEFKKTVLASIKDADSIVVVLVNKDKRLYQGFVSEGGDDSYKLITGLQITLNKLITAI